MQTVSIVIPNYNGERKLERFFESLLKQDYPLDHVQVCIGDDNSTDGSLEIIARYRDRLNIKCERSENHRGRSATANLALKLTDGDICIICDNDFELNQSFISCHVKRHQQAIHTIVVGALENRHTSPSIYTEFLDLFQARHNHYCKRRASSLPFIYFRANASFKKCELDAFDWFNEDFHVWGYEDVELGYRLARKGFRFIYEPGAVAFHHLAEQALATRCRRNYNCGKNKALFAHLYPEARYDVLCRQTECRRLSVKLHYALRAMVCRFINRNPLISHVKILNAFYRLVKKAEHTKIKSILFPLYHIVSGMFLEVSYYRHLSIRKKK